METKVLPLPFIRLTFLLLFLSTSSLATNYYISDNGNDSNTGVTPQQAWKSLERLNNLVPKPGDSILFRRGDAWNGTVTVNMWGMEGRPLVYGAYGKGQKPKIYGSEPITGWKKYSGNIYKTTFSKEINQLFVDGVKMKAARFPNSSYIFITSANGTTSITSDALDKRFDYSGSKWFGRTHYFTAPLLNVKSSRSQTLTLSEAPRHPLKKGLGFFLMGKLEFVDEAGEWYYDAATKTVYLWFPDNVSPEKTTIRGSVYKDGFYIEGKDHVTIRELTLLQQSEKGIHVENCNYIVIDDNDLINSDGFGIYCQTDATGYSITNNIVEGVNHYGMYLRISNSLISGNRISKIALFKNIGLTGTGEDNFGGGIYLAGEDGNNTVRYNELTEIGYNGILFARPKNIIEYNFIKDVCLLKSDMGAIYTSWYNKRAPQGPEGSIIRYNIILNVVGEKYGYTSRRNMGEGIYIDESAVGVLVENNTIAHCSNSGIKLHKTEGVTVRNNTILDVRQSIYVLKSAGTEKNTITNNVMVALRNEDDYLKRQVHINQSSGNAVFDHNNYINLYENEEVFLNGSAYFNFKNWKSLIRDESNSNVLISPLMPGEKEILLYNNSRDEKTIDLTNRSYKDINGKQVKDKVILQPYTSIILIGSVSGNL